MVNTEVIEQIKDGKTFTRKEVSERLGVSIMTINNYIKYGYLKAYKLERGKVYITENDLTEFLSNSITAK